MFVSLPVLHQIRGAQFRSREERPPIGGLHV
jgi:hypothetical protein